MYLLHNLLSSTKQMFNTTTSVWPFVHHSAEFFYNAKKHQILYFFIKEKSWKKLDFYYNLHHQTQLQIFHSVNYKCNDLIFTTAGLQKKNYSMLGY